MEVKVVEMVLRRMSRYSKFRQPKQTEAGVSVLLVRLVNGSHRRWVTASICSVPSMAATLEERRLVPPAEGQQCHGRWHRLARPSS